MLKKIFLATVITAGVFGGIYIYQQSDQDVDTKKTPTAKNLPDKETPQDTIGKVTVENKVDNENKAKILPVLKEVATAQSVWSQENGSYFKTMEKLEAKNFQLLKALLSAQKNKKDYLGFSFSDILDDKDTDDTRAHYGLLATPINSNGVKSYLLLMDQNLQQAFGENKTNNIDSDEIQFYESTVEKQMLNNWPSNTELLKWTRIKLNSSQEATKKLAP